MFKVEVDTSKFKGKSLKEIANYEKYIMLKNTLIMEELCKLECPVDTGRMRSSISSALNSKGATVTAHVDYAKYVIEGTQKQAPNNFNKRAIMTWKARGIDK